MLLLLTGLADGTVDFVVDYLEQPFFRFNLDDYKSYDFVITPTSWSIRNPVGLEITNLTATRCIWWKVFLYALNDDKFVKEEIRYIAQSLYSWFIARNLVIGNPPFLEDSWGKIRQASLAAKYFQVPIQSVGWGAGFGANFDPARSWVVKSLSSQLTTSGKAIFTTEVKPADLDLDFPWFIQEKVESDFDITVLIAGKEFFVFSRDRRALTSLDWRKEQFTVPVPWVPYPLSKEVLSALVNYVDEMGISWGRMDFLLVENELLFLEINLNGQWVFLDPTNETGMISAVARYFETGVTK